ncbi:MAG TPA: ATP-binding protein [Kofleriaceae bacterium]|nr:ATP-binding protein [Kofleriaceae bacterium]
MTGTRATVMLEGSHGVGRRTLAAIAADEARRPLLDVDLNRVGRTGAALEGVLLALRREVALRPEIILLFANVDRLVEVDALDGGRARILSREIDKLDVPVILTATTGCELPLSQTPLRLRVPSPSAETRLALWRRSAPEIEDQAIEEIARRYQIGPGTIASSAKAAEVLSRARGGANVSVRDLVDGVRASIAERMGGLAYRVETGERWDDLVLTQDTLDQINTLIARVRHATEVLDRWGMRARLPRGTGVAALFSGPPGTGKTMVAGLIARELDLELYQVDLSRVVSKWVGETEKQLASIFDAAEAGHALLLFDEADALFAKRTEVKAAVDRYANLEVNYLLQRVEAFGGVTILTTNMDTSIDPALKRRLAAHVVFWPPDEDERAKLWTKMIPPTAPREGELDFDELAAAFPDMAGANIRNAAVAAAFLAAAEGKPITGAHLQRAARLEYRSMGRVLGKRDGS